MEGQGIQEEGGKGKGKGGGADEKEKSKEEKEGEDEDEEPNEVILKRAVLVLNKLSLTKFDKLSNAFI